MSDNIHAHQPSAPPFDPLEGVQAGGPAGAIPFVYGHPDPDLLPVEKIIAATERALRARGRLALQYGPEQGYGPLLDYLIGKVERDEGLRIARANIMLCAGAAQGLDTVARLFARPGDVVLVEAPSYHEAIGTLRDHPVELRQSPIDDHGLVVEALAEQLDALSRAGRRVAFLYTIPTFQNPAGITLTVERRKALVELAVERGLLLVEDDVYRDLCFEGRVPPSLFELAGERGVIRLGSFSKILAAGLRLGWIIAEAEVIRRMVGCGLKGNEGGANPFVAHVVSAFCQEGWLEPHIAQLVARYRARRDALLKALEQEMPDGVHWTRPTGGFFLWLTLPEPLEAEAVLAEATERGVLFAPGVRFFAEPSGRGGRRNLRLPFSFLSETQMAAGVRALAAVIREQRID
ncbi:MAG: PLP-dependent aminotransferase family protein [Chloroflexi bacterium]|nr:PLP-dependent aminotransferase family protein [Chloroflexota bacterium]